MSLRKRVGNEAGITLVEIIFVLAIIGTLVAIFLPLAIEKLAEADRTRADADIDGIAAALTAFYSDLRQFPTCDSSNCASTEKSLAFLAYGTGTGSLSADYPGETASWGTLSTKDSSTAARNNAYNHLGQNDPAIGTPDSSTDYKTNKWKGPYMSKFNFDPWSKTYIAHVGGMQKGGSPVVSGGKGWIISAGPDNSLDTAPTASTLSSDDRGYVFTTNSG